MAIFSSYIFKVASTNVIIIFIYFNLQYIEYISRLFPIGALLLIINYETISKFLGSTKVSNSSIYHRDNGISET